MGVALASIPAGVAGLALQHVIETRLRSTTVVAWSTIVWALVLWWADRHAAGGGRVHDVHDVGIGRAIAIGLAQALALVPGTSRSGITISAGLFTGLDRSTAATFAFFLGLPVTIAAGFLETLALARSDLGAHDLAVLAIGVVTSFVAGLAAIRFLVAYLRRRTLLVFVAYRIVLGVLLLWLASRLRRAGPPAPPTGLRPAPPRDAARPHRQPRSPALRALQGVAVGVLVGEPPLVDREHRRIARRAGGERAELPAAPDCPGGRRGRRADDVRERHPEAQELRQCRRKVPDDARPTRPREIRRDRVGRKPLVERSPRHGKVHVIPAVGDVEDDARGGARPSPPP